MTAVPARITWEVDLIDPGPADRLLEVGCGPGVAAALVCARLTTGRLPAVDRSAVAVRRTAARNAGHVAAGRLSVGEGELAVSGEFDTAYAIDVNAFWTRPDGPAAAARRPGVRAVRRGTDRGGPDHRAGRRGDAAAGLADVRVVSGAGGFGVAARRRPEPG